MSTPNPKDPKKTPPKAKVPTAEGVKPPEKKEQEHGPAPEGDSGDTSPQKPEA